MASAGNPAKRGELRRAASAPAVDCANDHGYPCRPLPVRTRGGMTRWAAILAACAMWGGLAAVVPIGDDDVIELTLSPDEGARFRRQGRWIDQNAMLSHGEKQAVEIQLLLFGKPGPLPDTG